MIVPGVFVISSFPFNVCMFIVSKDLFISSATGVVRAGEAIWLNPFATVLFSMRSDVTVECCVLYPYLGSRLGFHKFSNFAYHGFPE